MGAISRCQWPGDDPLYIAYHDEEWGVPVHDDRRWFEYIVLDGAQAGLSWLTILRKRENYRRAFDHFDPAIVAGYDEAKIVELLADPGIVRNRLKVRSAISNAQAFLRVQEAFGSFDNYVWPFAGGRPIVNAWTEMSQIPAETEEARKLSKDLKQRGFSFVGPTIVYAFMQAGGLVNDHVVGCFRYPALADLL